MSQPPTVQGQQESQFLEKFLLVRQRLLGELHKVIIGQDQVIEAHLLQGGGVAVAAHGRGHCRIWRAAWLSGSWILLHDTTLC